MLTDFTDLAGALASIAVALVVALPLGPTLRRHPLPFYGVALLMVAAYLVYRYTGSYIPGAQAVVEIVQKGYLSCSLLAVVMYIGVFDETSAVRRRLQPIRAELSILSFLLILGHVLGYLPSYLPRMGLIFERNAFLSVSLVVALCLTLIFALLAALSIRVLRTRMPYKVWKGIQRLSYLMVALLLAHILLALGRSAFVGQGSADTAVALGVYAVLAVLYAVLRIRKAVRGARRRAEAK